MNPWPAQSAGVVTAYQTAATVPAVPSGQQNVAEWQQEHPTAARRVSWGRIQGLYR